MTWEAKRRPKVHEMKRTKGLSSLPSLSEGSMPNLPNCEFWMCHAIQTQLLAWEATEEGNVELPCAIKCNPFEL